MAQKVALTIDGWAADSVRRVASGSKVGRMHRRVGSLALKRTASETGLDANEARLLAKLIGW
eukprot:3740074-Rhodomonas_salina.1